MTEAFGEPFSAVFTVYLLSLCISFMGGLGYAGSYAKFTSYDLKETDASRRRALRTKYRNNTAIFSVIFVIDVLILFNGATWLQRAIALVVYGVMLAWSVMHTLSKGGRFADPETERSHIKTLGSNGVMLLELLIALICYFMYFALGLRG